MKKSGGIAYTKLITLYYFIITLTYLELPQSFLLLLIMYSIEINLIGHYFVVVSALVLPTVTLEIPIHLELELNYIYFYSVKFILCILEECLISELIPILLL